MKIYEVSGMMVSAELPLQVVAAFDQLGELQRDVPERVMVRAQRLMGGGVLNYAIEHVGDLTHRMTRQGPLLDWGLEAAAEKIEKMNRLLNRSYGFDREFEQNMHSNAEYFQKDLALFRREVDAVLLEYAEAHSQLPVYNYAQYLARDAAVLLGRQSFSTAAMHLATMNSWIKDAAVWKAKALEYKLDSTGNILEWPYPRQ